MSAILLGDPTSIKDPAMRAMALSSGIIRLGVREYETLHDDAEKAIQQMHPGLPSEHEMSDEQLTDFTPKIDKLILQRFCMQYHVQASAVTAVFVVGNGADFGVLETPDAFPNSTLFRLR